MINCSTYFFEGTRRGYSQYPQDFAENIFRSYYDHFTSDAQLVVHRQPNLMYYTYMKRLPGDAEESFFGISVVLNGLETTSIKSLFKLFERTFHQIVSDGEILTINAEGAIASKDIVFGAFAGTFDRHADNIKTEIHKGESFFREMSAMIYSATDADFTTVPIDEKEAVFQMNLTIYNKLFITKNSNTTSAELNGLAVRIENLSDQNQYLKERISELEGSVKSYGRWKSLAIGCISFVAVLAISLVYCFVCGLISVDL